MTTKIVENSNPDALGEAAERIAAGELIAVYFQGTYAFLCDCDAEAPAEKIFQIKNRPREKGLSLVVDPEFLPDFVELGHPSFKRFPLEKSVELQRNLHAVGLVFPVGRNAPADLIHDGTILNVWSEYPPHRPLSQLTKLAREKGVRGFKGASTNLRHQPTYSTVDQVLAQFGGQIPLILDGFDPVPEERRKSTTLVDLTEERPLVIRAGNVTIEELQEAFDQIGYGPLEIAPDIKIL